MSSGLAEAGLVPSLILESVQLLSDHAAGVLRLRLDFVSEEPASSVTGLLAQLREEQVEKPLRDAQAEFLENNPLVRELAHVRQALRQTTQQVAELEGTNLPPEISQNIGDDRLELLTRGIMGITGRPRQEVERIMAGEDEA